MPASLAQLFGDRPALTLTTCKAAVTAQAFKKALPTLPSPMMPIFMVPSLSSLESITKAVK
jgi:hypothetical protein